MSKRILVVEDQEDSKQVMNDLLSNAGYEVIGAVTGDQGLAAAETEKPDLILMDIMLPVMDGHEVTRRIKANDALKHIPVIAVTSYAMDGEETKAQAAGCDAYFSKPVSPRELLAKVREFLD